MPSPNSPTSTETPTGAGIALLPLLAAIAIMLTITVCPQLLANARGQADHLAAMVLFWAMAAGFVRGVGFVPHHAIWRWMFSAAACWLGTALALWRLFQAN